MKIILTAFLLISLCWQCIATEQTPDVFILNSKEAELYTSWGFQSPLEHYFSKSKTESPFEMESTGNYRGHVAHWEVIDKKLFLKKVTVDAEGEEYVQNANGRYSEKREPYELSKVFESGITPEGKFADWFTGAFLVFIDPYKETHESGGYSIKYKEFRILEFNEGIISEQHSLKPDEYYKAVHAVHEKGSKAKLSPTEQIVKQYFDAQKSD